MLTFAMVGQVVTVLRDRLTRTHDGQVEERLARPQRSVPVRQRAQVQTVLRRYGAPGSRARCPVRLRQICERPRDCARPDASKNR